METVAYFTKNKFCMVYNLSLYLLPFILPGLATVKNAFTKLYYVFTIGTNSVPYLQQEALHCVNSTV